jgi:cytochrome P450
MASASTPSEYDPFSPEFQADPFSVYRWMLDETPVYYSEKWNWWALSRFADVRAAALDPDTFRSFEGIDIDDTAKDQSGPGFLPDVDDPRHDQLRRLVQGHFLPRRIAAQEDSIRAVVRGLIAGWPDRGQVDLAQELSWPMPNEVFFNLVGLPSAREAGRDQLEKWVHELKDREPGDTRLTAVAKAATAGIQTYFVELLNERRRHPREDLLTHLVYADIDGVPFTEERITARSEILGLMTVLFLGGVETTAGLTSTMFKLLAENPDQRELLQKDPSLIPVAVEETIRCATPLQLAGRTAIREVTLHGVTIPAGGRVVLVYGAANRDPRQFHDPDRFDVTRGRFRHLGFGEGLHGCLGAPLARLEVQVAAEEALPVLGDYLLSGPPVRYRSTPNAYVWSHLPLSFRTLAQRAGWPAGTLTGDRPRTATAAGKSSTAARVGSEFEAELQICAKQQVAEDVVTLELREIGGHPLPAWAPGAHVDLILDEAPTRQYSPVW